MTKAFLKAAMLCGALSADGLRMRAPEGGKPFLDTEAETGGQHQETLDIEANADGGSASSSAVPAPVPGEAAAVDATAVVRDAGNPIDPEAGPGLTRTLSARTTGVSNILGLPLEAWMFKAFLVMFEVYFLEGSLQGNDQSILEGVVLGVVSAAQHVAMTSYRGLPFPGQREVQFLRRLLCSNEQQREARMAYWDAGMSSRLVQRGADAAILVVVLALAEIIRLLVFGFPAK